MKQSKDRAIIFILLSSIMAGSGQLLFKTSTLGTEQYFDIFTTPWFYLGITCYTMATFLMILSFKNGELSILFPILSTTYIWTIVLSVYLFEDETINSLRTFGIFVIIIGACCLSLQQKKNSSAYRLLSNQK